MHSQTRPSPYFGSNPVSPALNLKSSKNKFGPKTSTLMLTAIGLAPLLPGNVASAGANAIDSFSDPLDSAKPVPILILQLRKDRFKLNTSSFDWKNFELAGKAFRQDSRFRKTKPTNKKLLESKTIIGLLKNKAAKENLDLSALSLSNDMLHKVQNN